MVTVGQLKPCEYVALGYGNYYQFTFRQSDSLPYQESTLQINSLQKQISVAVLSVNQSNWKTLSRPWCWSQDSSNFVLLTILFCEAIIDGSFVLMITFSPKHSWDSHGFKELLIKPPNFKSKSLHYFYSLSTCYQAIPITALLLGLCGRCRSSH